MNRSSSMDASLQPSSRGRSHAPQRGGDVNRVAPPLHDDRPTVVAFGGGKGGTGRSTLCADIARALTRHDFRVLCVDMAMSCPTLNILLRCPEPAFADGGDARTPLGESDSHIAEFIVPTGYDDVFLTAISVTQRYPFSPLDLDPMELLTQLHELDFDYVFLDLSNQVRALDVELFALSDIPILVASPEPASLRATTQYLRATLFRAIAYHPDAADFEDDLIESLFHQPLDFRTHDLRLDVPSSDARAIIDDTLERLETYMLVNLVREGAEHDLGFVLSHALYCELRLFPRVLASIEYADRRWFYNRRTTGTNTSRNEDGLTNDIELLARHIRDIELVDLRYPRPIPTADDAHPARRMGLNPELSRNEVRQYCRRLWEGYRREHAISLVFANGDRRIEVADRLEKLYRQVLTMPSENFTAADADSSSPRRPATRPTQRRTDTAPPPPAAERKEASPSDDSDSSPADKPPTGDGATPSKKPAPDKPSRPSGPTPGDRLVKLRQSRSMSLQELSSRTHIGVKYLAAIEDIDLDVLPRHVYLRGYLREIARIFDIDAAQLIADYFEFLDAL